jgi:transketolase
MPEVLLMATGSEVAPCLQAHELLVKQGIKSRIVSMPCWELFAKQPQSYRDSVLPPLVRARVSVEAGATLGWERFVGLDGAMLGMVGFGQSAPAGKLFEHFGFTVENIRRLAHEQAQKNRARV